MRTRPQCTPRCARQAATPVPQWDGRGWRSAGRRSEGSQISIGAPAAPTRRDQRVSGQISGMVSTVTAPTRRFIGTPITRKSWNL